MYEKFYARDYEEVAAPPPAQPKHAYVLMGNDYPEAVYLDGIECYKEAAKFTEAQRKLRMADPNIYHMTSYIYWRAVKVELR